MLLIATLDRPLRVLANAPLFRHPLIGPFLRLIGGLPVHRRKEAGDDPNKNAALFAATTAALRAGGAIAIFPEGRTQPEPALQEVRTGTARMLLAAAEGGAAAVRCFRWASSSTSPEPFAAAARSSWSARRSRGGIAGGARPPRVP